MNYIYDGTFPSFLCVIHAHYYMEKATNIVDKSTLALGSGYQDDLLISSTEISTDSDKANIVYEAIESKISKWDLERIYRVFRTNIDEKEMKLLRYIILGFKYGSKIRLLHTHSAVLDVEMAERKIGNEVHRLCGLIRFSGVNPMMSSSNINTENTENIENVTFVTDNIDIKKINNVINVINTDISNVGVNSFLYSTISPDHDVLEFIAPHFSDRLKNEPFIIYDTKRDKAIIAYGGKWEIRSFTEEDAMRLIYTDDENMYRLLWKKYFKTMAIKERTNPKCQKNFMPIRYWENLTEMQQ